MDSISLRTLSSLRYSASGITSLKSVTFGNGITTIGDNTFNGCTGLTSINIPDSVTTIGKDAFFGCTGLTSVTIGNGVTTIGDNAFSGCTSLASIDVEEGNTAYSSVNGVLFNKDRTEICQYPAGKTDTVYTVPDSVTSLGDNAFNGCTGLTSVTIGNGVTTISDNAFNGCTSLTSIEVDRDNPAFSSSDGYLLNKAGDELLVCPAGLESATVGNGITKVSEGAFSGDKLKEVVFSGTSVSVAECAFYNCASLNKIVIGSPDVVFLENSITFTGSEKHTLHVVAPKGYQIPNNAMSANVDIVYDGQSSDPDDEGSKTLIGIAIAIVILLALASLVPQITRRP
ncbi:MAG: leucine-rich repeat domain-containing protein [Candidatus Methanomethylophilaceae archaeon]|nr:leucine-rich repeat domain-containing protein [Candidatus Methanomethylophilaceae archaeon]